MYRQFEIFLTLEPQPHPLIFMDESFSNINNRAARVTVREVSDMGVDFNMKLKIQTSLACQSNDYGTCTWVGLLFFL